MRKYLLVIFVIAFLFSVIAVGETAPKAQAVVLAQSTYLSDYNFQLDQYRKNYAEYTNFKKDYDDRPTLNNEQKALLSARQTIISRELAWANFYLVLSESIAKPGVNYPLVNLATTNLATVANYHFGQATKANSIVTRTDLTAFTKEELVVLESERLSVVKAQVANKLAGLIKFQVDAKTAYDSLVPKLEAVKNEVSVKNGLDQIEVFSGQINAKIEAVAKKTTDFKQAEGSVNQFYSDTGESLKEIRGLQNRLVAVIIDLDTNYVRH